MTAEPIIMRASIVSKSPSADINNYIINVTNVKPVEKDSNYEEVQNHSCRSRSIDIFVY